MSNSNQNLFHYIGDLSQVAGIKHLAFQSGRAKGVEAFETRTGAGLTYTVLKDRCLDLAWAEFKGTPFGFISNTGVVAPAFFEAAGTGFMRSFTAGLLTTCGMTYSGAACEDQGQSLGLHGRIANTPAEEVGYETVRQDDGIEFVIRGKVREASFFNENLVLERQIRSRFGENKIRIEDRVVNLGFRTEPLMMLYHFNFGYPLLQEGTEIVAPLQRATPRDARAAAGLADHFRVEAPQAGFAEQVYYLDLTADAAGNTQIGLLQPAHEFGVYLKFNKGQFPRLIQWKQMGQGFYVMGIEPSNCLPEGRAKERERGMLPFINPGEVREFQLELGVLETREAIATFREQVGKLLP